MGFIGYFVKLVRSALFAPAFARLKRPCSLTSDLLLPRSGLSDPHSNPLDRKCFLFVDQNRPSQFRASTTDHSDATYLPKLVVDCVGPPQLV